MNEQSPQIIPITLDLKLDLGCGPNKRPGFVGADSIAFPGVDVVTNLVDPVYVPLPDEFKHLDGLFERKRIGFEEWPWPNDSVSEVHCSHFVEHLDHNAKNPERVHFFNELWRVMKPGAKATIITPFWASCRAYGDYTHADKPVAEFAWYYLKRDWRMQNAPHNDVAHVKEGYLCNFEVTWGYALHPELLNRNQEYQNHALTFWKEAAQDMHATLVKLP